MLRIDGVKGILREAPQFTRWLRSKDGKHQDQALALVLSHNVNRPGGSSQAIQR